MTHNCPDHPALFPGRQDRGSSGTVSRTLDIKQRCLCVQSCFHLLKLYLNVGSFFNRQFYLFISILYYTGSLLLRRLFSSGERGFLFDTVHGLLTGGFSVQSTGSRHSASIAAALGLSNCDSKAPEHRPSSCGTWA